jgi:hypothetical protein
VKLISISTSAWRNNHGRSCSLIQEILNENSNAPVTLDVDTVLRSGSANSGAISSRLIAISSWLKKGTDEYIVEYPSVQDSAARLDPSRPVFLDGAGYPATVILDVLRAVRQAWYLLDVWPTGFVLICDDTILLDISEAVVDTFYTRPTAFTAYEVAKMARQLQKHGVIARWVGPKRIRTFNMINRMWGRIDAFFFKQTEKQIAQAEKWMHQ